jgi:cell division protein FtsI/penicillin-binding protein 2
MHTSRLAPWILAPCGALFLFLAIPSRGQSAPEAAATPSASEGLRVPSAGDGASVAPAPPPAQPVLGAMSLDAARARFVAPYGPGRATLSVSPHLQVGLEKLLSDYRVPLGAVVVVETRTGRVLALAEHGEKGQGRGAALAPVAPAASIFKIVTSAALLERGIAPDSEICFHGGKHRIQKALLADNPRRDRRCLTLANALGKSANVVFAKLAGRELSAALLRDEATRFLFDQRIPFEWPVEPSTALISQDPFELATTAAGFGPVRLSPLHGALIASIVATGGVLVPPRVIDGVEGAPAPAIADPRRVVSADVAKALAEMMRTTVTDGTARKVFRRDRWSRRSPLREVTVAGKTGSLSDAQPFKDYSWFVGFAPVDDPQVAVAAVVVNGLKWRIHAPYIAREALKAYLVGGPLGPPPVARVKHYKRRKKHG